MGGAQPSRGPAACKGGRPLMLDGLNDGRMDRVRPRPEKESQKSRKKNISAQVLGLGHSEDLTRARVSPPLMCLHPPSTPPRATSVQGYCTDTHQEWILRGACTMARSSRSISFATSGLGPSKSAALSLTRSTWVPGWTRWASTPSTGPRLPMTPRHTPASMTISSGSDRT